VSRIGGRWGITVLLSIAALAFSAGPALASGGSVSAGNAHSCALKDDGTPVCWGRNSESQTTIPAGTGALSRIGAGGYHTCGVKTDGTVACWGDDVVGQTDVPPGTGAVTQLSVGFTHTCVIRTDGTPACWGLNDDHQIDIPSGTGTVSQISAGGFHTCAIETGGTPACWGWGDLGQTTIPAGTGTVTQISAGLQHTCAIKPGGTPVCWGDDSEGQSTIPASVGTVTQISAGALHTCAIETGGTPVCWGKDASGQSTVPSGIGTVTRISAGFSHTCAVKTGGGVVCWGDDSSGQRGTPPAITSGAPPAHASAHAYTHTVTTTGQFGPTLSVTAGALPPGLSLTAGQITGTPTATGVYTGTISASDGVFADATQAFSIDVDADAPATTDDVPAGPVNHDVTVTLTAHDDGWGGLAHTYYTTDGTAPTSGSAEYDSAHKPVLHDGERIRYFSTDGAGNAETPHASPIAHVDTVPPATTDDVPAGYIGHDVTVTLTSSDAEHTYYTTDGTAPTSGSAAYDAAHKPVLHDGEVIRYFSTDAAGNAETPHASPVAHVDTTAPTTTDDVPAGAVNHDIVVTLTAADAGSGVAHTYYTTNGTDPTTASPQYDAGAKPVLHSGDQIRYFSVDAVGNAEAIRTSGAPVDTTAPTVAITSPANGATYLKGSRILAAYTCSDTCTGTVAKGAPVDTRAAGRHTFTVTARDAAGNRTSRTVAYTVTAPVTPAADTTGPAVTIPPKNKTLKVRSNKVTFTLGSVLEPTSGAIVLKAKGVKYGSGLFTGAAGTASKVKIKLTAKARKALKKHKKLKAVATITVRDAAGNPTVKTYKVTIKRG
jgi:alpha-tubulin suppressor-like RCC1 family protein